MVRSIQQARDLLGVAADSDPATLAHAYRRLARANHPDVSAEPDAAQRFATITTAYHLLRDHAEPPTSKPPTSDRPGTQVTVHVNTDTTFNPSASRFLDRTGSRSATPGLIVSSADESSRSAAAFGPRGWSASVVPSPIVAGPVTVTPVPRSTVGDPTQEAR